MVADGGAQPADVNEMALQSFRIRFLATRTAVLICRRSRLPPHAGECITIQVEYLGRSKSLAAKSAAISESPSSTTCGKLNIEAAA
jgi:hypothetical protein